MPRVRQLTGRMELKRHCREMAMSRVNFYKKILALTDKTPSEFIHFIRLKRAAELLDKSQMYVNEIAFLVGFNETKYFRKYFKEEFGVTPNEYKRTITQLTADASFKVYKKKK